MLEILATRKKDLENRIRQLDRKAIRRGVFDLGELDAGEAVEYFSKNFRLRIYDGEIMDGDDLTAIRNHVAGLISAPENFPEISLSGISSRDESVAECRRILDAVGKQ